VSAAVVEQKFSEVVVEPGLMEQKFSEGVVEPGVVVVVVVRGVWNQLRSPPRVE
jgi:hypothetical protein